MALAGWVALCTQQLLFVLVSLEKVEAAGATGGARVALVTGALPVSFPSSGTLALAIP